MLKTFMHGHSCMMTFLHFKVHNADPNFLLIEFSKFSIGSVFHITAPWVWFQHLNVAMLKTFMSGDLSALE